MRYLVSLELNGNKLTGGIPPQYWNTLTLQGLNLVENMLTGTLSTRGWTLDQFEGASLESESISGDTTDGAGKSDVPFLRTSKWKPTNGRNP
jgi:hypothetical protein